MKRRKPAGSRKWILGLLTACLSLLLLEGGVRLLEALFLSTRSEEAYASGKSPFIDYRNVRPLFELRQLQEEPSYVRTAYHPFVSRDLHFPARKTSNTLRIFCLGGSAAMGWPHDLSLSYPAFLQQKLEKLFPDRNIEVINAAASTYASFRVKALFDEIVNYDPDLILIYSGNNEFLERILYQEEEPLQSPWNRLATVRTIHRAARYWKPQKQVIDLEQYRPTFMIDIALGNTAQLKTSPRQLAKVQAHFRYNLSEMVRKAKKRGISVALLNVPVNLKDWTPHASIHQPGLDTGAWQRYYRKGREAQEKDDHETAIRAFRQCLRLDSAHAHSQYLLGKSLLSQRQTSEARQAFLRALENDAYPFRALQTFNQTISDLAIESEVPFIDIVSVLEAKTADRMLGEEVLIDHVHPTVASNEAIADAVLRELIRAGLLPENDNLTPDSLHVSYPDDAEQTLSVLRHLFLIYRVLLQFDKLERLQSELKTQPASVPRSTTYYLLSDELNRYLEVARPYAKLMRRREEGLADSLHQPDEIRMIIQNYIQMSRNSLTHDMPDHTFEAFIPK